MGSRLTAPERSTEPWNGPHRATGVRLTGVSGSKRYRGRGRAQTDSRASLEVQLEFYSGMVNSDKYLPKNMISNRMCDAMLAHGLVTPERLRMRGVL